MYTCDYGYQWDGEMVTLTDSSGMPLDHEPYKAKGSGNPNIGIRAALKAMLKRRTPATT